MTNKSLSLSAFLMLSPLTVIAQETTGADIDKAIEARDVDGLMILVKGESVNLDEDQSIEARLLLLEHLVALDPAEDEKREQTARALLVLNPDNRVVAQIVGAESGDDPSAGDA